LKSERWEEVSRREIGVAPRMVERVGAIFAILYEVTEVQRDKDGVPVKWRARFERGVDIRQVNERNIGVVALLEVVAKGTEALAHIARADDEKAQKQKRATSRRKGR
jgi:hypothetical protein